MRLVKRHLSRVCMIIACCFPASLHASVLNNIPESGHLIYKKRYQIPLGSDNSTTNVCGPHRGLGLAWHPRKKQIAVSIASGPGYVSVRPSGCIPIATAVKVFDLSGESPTLYRTVRDASARYSIPPIAYNHKGDRLAEGNNTTIYIHDLSSNTTSILHTIRGITGGGHDIDYSEDGKKMAATGSWVYDLSESANPYRPIHRSKTFPRQKVITSVAFNSNATYLAEGYTADEGRSGHFVNVYSLNASTPFEMTPVYTMDDATNGVWDVEYMSNTLLAAGSGEGAIRFYNISDAVSKAEVEKPVLVFNDTNPSIMPAITALSADRQNQRLAVVGKNALFKIYDMNNLSVTTILPDNRNETIHSVAFSPSNPNWLAITGDSEVIDIYELATVVNTEPPSSSSSYTDTLTTVVNTEPPSSSASRTETTVLGALLLAFIVL